MNSQERFYQHPGRSSKPVTVNALVEASSVAVALRFVQPNGDTLLVTLSAAEALKMGRELVAASIESDELKKAEKRGKSTGV